MLIITYACDHDVVSRMEHGLVAGTVYLIVYSAIHSILCHTCDTYANLKDISYKKKVSMCKVDIAKNTMKYI